MAAHLPICLPLVRGLVLRLASYELRAKEADGMVWGHLSCVMLRMLFIPTRPAPLIHG